MTIEHKVAPLGEIHVAHNWEYADAAAREAATITDASLVKRLALQLDDMSYWTLTSVSPVTWSPVSKGGTGGGTGGPIAISDVTGLQGALDGKADDADVAALNSALGNKADAAAVNAALQGKANSSHTHNISDINGLQTALNAKGGPVALQTAGTEQTPAVTALNFTGAGATVSVSNGVATIDIPLQASSGGGGALAVQDEGTTLSTGVTTMNFSGGGVTATVNGSTITVTVPTTTLASLGIANVENKSAADILAALTLANVTNALGFTPANAANFTNVENKSGSQILAGLTSSNVTTALGFTPADAASKGQANGLASLDGTGKVPASQLPSYVDDVLEFANQAALPATGQSGVIYITTDTTPATQWRWTGSSYQAFTSSPGTTDAVTEGSTNKYFTENRVLATILAGFSTATNAAVTAADSVLAAFGKIQAQINAHTTALGNKEGTIAGGTTAQYWRGDKTFQDFATDVRAAALTGLSTATNAVIGVGDNVLGAFGKLQAQITAILGIVNNTQTDKGNSGTSTVTFNRTTGGMYQKVTVTGVCTLAAAGWEAAGKVSEMEVEIANGGAFAVTMFTGVLWKNPDGTTTTNFNTYLTNIGRTGLQTSGIDLAYLRTSDGGTTILGEIA